MGIKKLFQGLSGKKTDYDEEEDANDPGYVELGTDVAAGEKGGKVFVRSFTIEDFGGIKPVLDTLREGMTICLVNIRPLKEKDLIELKRAINKLKKTCEAIEGDIAGFGDDFIVVTPSFAQIYRAGKDAKGEGDDADEDADELE